jgi:hypothetical protein
MVLSKVPSVFSPFIIRDALQPALQIACSDPHGANHFGGSLLGVLHLEELPALELRAFEEKSLEETATRGVAMPLFGSEALFEEFLAYQELTCRQDW